MLIRDQMRKLSQLMLASLKPKKLIEPKMAQVILPDESAIRRLETLAADLASFDLEAVPEPELVCEALGVLHVQLKEQIAPAILDMQDRRDRIEDCAVEVTGRDFKDSDGLDPKIYRLPDRDGERFLIVGATGDHDLSDVVVVLEVWKNQRFPKRTSATLQECLDGEAPFLDEVITLDGPAIIEAATPDPSQRTNLRRIPPLRRAAGD